MRRNLISLQQTADLMDQTQTRLSTGKKVNTALDDPINFFAAQGHTQRASDLEIRKDGMSEAIQTVTAADNGITGLTDLINSAKALAQSAQSATTTSEANSLGEQFNELLDQIDTMAEDSFYKGINLLGGTSVELKVDFDEKGDSSITLQGFAGTSGGLGIADATGSDGVYWADLTSISVSAITTSLAQLDTALDTLRTESKTLAANLNVITTRQDFTTNMINTLEDGAANLTLADMNEEGANMLMLQTRQSLGTTSLSLASQAAQSVLQLF
jgi:flagellin-like hook-associated protein FlgL